MSEAVRLMDPDSFLEWCTSQEDRYELVGGVPVAMAGAKRGHDRIVMNTTLAVGNQSRGSPCQPFSADFAVATLTDIATSLETARWTADDIKGAVEAVGERHGIKLGKLQGPLRIAITGRSVGPPLFEPIELLGRDETLRRIHSALSRASR